MVDPRAGLATGKVVFVNIHFNPGLFHLLVPVPLLLARIGCCLYEGLENWLFFALMPIFMLNVKRSQGGGFTDTLLLCL